MPGAHAECSRAQQRGRALPAHLAAPDRVSTWPRRTGAEDFA
eukprot:CAMPEP_0174736786 /NCGR_PEP_ID=MMETSP1094-20130205/67268_1 /TAXON_ID=156173 /ORGANISM="Chrysochromulina brevifilum, Strain UTEX LB 985" /LENGTH=41 /DNA_ID= /DNA_START= /DNA_END= /DNA_ORIENTATION=